MEVSTQREVIPHREVVGKIWSLPGGRCLKNRLPVETDTRNPRWLRFQNPGRCKRCLKNRLPGQNWYTKPRMAPFPQPRLCHRWTPLSFNNHARHPTPLAREQASITDAPAVRPYQNQSVSIRVIRVSISFPAARRTIGLSCDRPGLGIGRRVRPGRPLSRWHTSRP